MYENLSNVVIPDAYMRVTPTAVPETDIVRLHSQFLYLYLGIFFTVSQALSSFGVRRKVRSTAAEAQGHDKISGMSREPFPTGKRMCTGTIQLTGLAFIHGRSQRKNPIISRYIGNRSSRILNVHPTTSVAGDPWRPSDQTG